MFFNRKPIIDKDIISKILEYSNKYRVIDTEQFKIRFSENKFKDNLDVSFRDVKTNLSIDMIFDKEGQMTDIKTYERYKDNKIKISSNKINSILSNVFNDVTLSSENIRNEIKTSQLKI